MPIVNAAITVPCEATRNCIRNILVVILPRCLYLYAPIPNTVKKPAIPKIKVEKRGYY